MALRTVEGEGVVQQVSVQQQILKICECVSINPIGQHEHKYVAFCLRKSASGFGLESGVKYYDRHKQKKTKTIATNKEKNNSRPSTSALGYNEFDFFKENEI